MELRDAYDENKNPVKTYFKGEQLESGFRVLVVVVWIENDGKYLIQKTSKEKESVFTTTGGHPKSGETNYVGIITEVKEELGIELNPKELILYDEFKHEKVFFDSFYTTEKVNINDLVLQEDEVEYVVWLTDDEIKELYEKGKFKENHYRSYLKLLEYKKNNK